MTVKESEKFAQQAITGANFTAFNAGSLEQLFQYEIQHPKIRRTVKGKLFLREILGLTGMQVSLNRLPAGVSVPFIHQHKENEELYIFIKGSGQMQIDDEVVDVSEGTSVRIAPSGKRVWRNNSSEDLYYIVIQAKDGSLDRDTFEDGIALDEPPVWK